MLLLVVYYTCCVEAVDARLSLLSSAQPWLARKREVEMECNVFELGLCRNDGGGVGVGAE